jgi:hypothetical protein
MMKSTLSRLLPLVVGSAAAGVLASMSPARAITLNVNGQNVEADKITVNAGNLPKSIAQIKHSPWWTNSGLAKMLSSDEKAKGGIFVYNAVKTDAGKISVDFFQDHEQKNQILDPTGYTAPNQIQHVVVQVPFDISGSATIPAVGALLLAARWKARKSIASKTRTANPDVAVS